MTATPTGADTAGADTTTGTAGSDALLEVRHLVQEFVLRDYGGVKGGVLQAVSDVSFDLHAGETLGIVGETGSGKSTLARSVIQAPPPKHGQVIFEGQDLVRLPHRAMKSVRRDLQMVFQDPFRSLDPKWTVSRIVTEPLIAYGIGSRAERRERVRSLLDLVGLDPASYGGRRPRELSGGQAQRVAIARALVLEPKLILCDEPVSSLDVLVQAQVLNLFEKLRADLGLSYLFIAHDLALVKQVSDRVAVMYLGKLCEIGPVRDIYREPLHPYTLALLNSIPNPDPSAARRETGSVISGELPSPLDPPSGCRFRTRCPRAEERCAAEAPQLRPLADGRLVACHFPLSQVATSKATAGQAAAGDDGGSEAQRKLTTLLLMICTGGEGPMPDAQSIEQQSAATTAPATAPATGRPPFRADHVGSLLRPPDLLRARDATAAGQISGEQLRAAEDTAIREVVRRQQEVGLASATDGELRRESWHMDFIYQLGGVKKVQDDTIRVAFHNKQKEYEWAPPSAHVVAPLTLEHTIFGDAFTFLADTVNAAAAVPKLTIPSLSMVHYRGGRSAIDESVYPDLGQFWADLAAAYAEEVRRLYDLGCRYLQLDDTSLAYVNDPAQRQHIAEIGGDPEHQHEQYIANINRALAGRPPDLAVTTHMCRGNNQSMWAAEGGYDFVAEALFNELEVDGFFCEWDDERSGGFEPLRFVPKGKRVVLGLVTTKRGELESKDELKRRIDAAARFTDLDQLCLSPQCGFSSTKEGNDITPDQQWAKLALIVETAQEVWGSL